MARLDDGAERARIRREFHKVVNLTAVELERWLDTPESHGAGWRRPGARESVGHQSGRRILGLLRKDAVELDDEDYAHMRRVVGFCRRHLAQGGPAKDRETSRWRHSLMNWGHDPLKG